ncbi:MAG: hypothetical protein H7257_05565 [Taibaiella sp.]|nr:hypothetical protein [Taibaiella sp.]
MSVDFCKLNIVFAALMVTCIHNANAQLVEFKRLMPFDTTNALTPPRAVAVPVTTFNLQLVPKDIYTKNFGFFCRQELRMYKAHVPVSFRLGSMDYCNRLEQKR